jgi:DNA-binding PadR family transcriptional regulator
VSKLSHLAYIALGVVAESQPCSGYAVMKQFQSSSSTYFSGSAGAIYPLLRRLGEAGLIKEQRHKAGSRTRRTYTLTEQGSSALLEWVCAPLPAEDVAFTVDLLRTRCLFFERLPKAKRRSFVKDARSQLKARIKDFEGRIADEKKYTQLERVSFHSVCLIDKARLKWLDVVEKELC